MEVGRAFLLSSQKTMIWGILIYDMCRCRRDLDPLFYLKGALIKLFIWWHKTPSALKGRMLQIAPIFDNMCHVIANIFLSVLSSIEFFVGLLNGRDKKSWFGPSFATGWKQFKQTWARYQIQSEKIAVSRPFVLNEFFWVEFLSY